MMEQRQQAPHLACRDERRLLRLAIQAAKSDFPNPERLGCPGRGVLEAMARRRQSFPDAEDVIDHVATCAPCFDEYASSRRRHRFRVVSRVALVCAASLVLTIAVWRRVDPELVSVRKTPAATFAEPTLTAMLDFRKWTAERSGRSHVPAGVEIPHLRRALTAMAIKLPIGTEDGAYSVQVRDRLDQTVVEAAGNAKWDGSAEVLTATVNLRGLRAGEYVLAIGNNSSSWRRYPVRLE